MQTKRNKKTVNSNTTDKTPTTEQKQEITSNIIDINNKQSIENLRTNTAKLAVQEAENLKGKNITLLDVKEITSISDYVLIITGTSSTHCKAIAENLRVEAKKNKCNIIGFESAPQSEWTLLELDDTIVHVMQEQAREYYALEKLWQMVVTKASDSRE